VAVRIAMGGGLGRRMEAGARARASVRVAAQLDRTDGIGILRAARRLARAKLPASEQANGRDQCPESCPHGQETSGCVPVQLRRAWTRTALPCLPRGTQGCNICRYRPGIGRH